MCKPLQATARFIAFAEVHVYSDVIWFKLKLQSSLFVCLFAQRTVRNIALAHHLHNVTLNSATVIAQGGRP